MIRRNRDKIIRVIGTAIFWVWLAGPACAEKKEAIGLQEGSPEIKASAKELPARHQVKYEAAGLRDPFPPQEKKPIKKTSIVQPVKKPTTAEVKEAEIVPPKLTIEGLIWGGAIAQAVINGKVVKEGDVIDGATITKINRGGVDILYKNKKFSLISPSLAQKGDSKKRAEGDTDEK